MYQFMTIEDENKRRRRDWKNCQRFCEQPHILLALDRDENAMRLIFEGLQLHYIQSLTTGRLDVWARAAHASIDLLADPFNSVRKRAEISVTDEMRNLRR